MNNPNPHLGGDALALLNEIVPDTPETRLVERQELFRLSLTQSLRKLRKKVGLDQSQVAQKLGVSKQWVERLESVHSDHPLQDVIAYLSALDADLELSIFLGSSKFDTVPGRLNEEIEFSEAIASIFEE